MVVEVKEVLMPPQDQKIGINIEILMMDLYNLIKSKKLKNNFKESKKFQKN